MIGFPGRLHVTLSKAASRLGLAVLPLLVGGSLALGAGAVRIYTLPVAAVPMPAEAWPAPAPAAAEQGDQNDQNVRIGPQPAAQELSRTQAVALVQQRYHARVVRSELQRDQNGRRLYLFRLLSASGKVWTVRIDAHSGAELP